MEHRQGFRKRRDYVSHRSVVRLPPNKVKIRITRILEKGECPLGHKVGEEFIYPEDRGKICASAMHSIFPTVRVLQFGGSFPWEEYPDRAVVCCPDAKNPVVFNLKRVKMD